MMITRNLMKEAMKKQPIQLQLIMPKHASPGTRAKFRYLRKLISGKHTIQLRLTAILETEGEFIAHISFHEGDAAPVVELTEQDYATEADVRSVVAEFLKNPLAATQKPSQRVYAVISALHKPVRLQLLCDICREMLKLKPETIRGTLNKNHARYLSPKHGVWCSAELAERMGWGDCR